MNRVVLTGKHFMNGDLACANGAIAAGCKFFAGYPITPSTEIAEHLAQRLPEVGGTFIQMEDELGSMAAVLGASAAGVRAMTATSGPGLSLMLENIGLGVMLELPAVVVNVQRGSPSTGLPTMVGQGDVMQAKWGSHGDYEIISYAPSSVQEMFNLTIQSFNMADRYRTPVILLADEVVGHMIERLEIPSIEEIPHFERKRPTYPPGDERFLPFKVEDNDLVPPMVHAGEGYRIHMTGLTHDERGYPNMSAEVHDALVRRLNEKIRKNKGDIIVTEDLFLDDARIVVVSYGCTARSARQAVRHARQDGLPVGFLRLVSIWPFPNELFEELSDRVDAFVTVEINLGQIRYEIQKWVDSPVYGVHHSGGALIPPETILDKLRKVTHHGHHRKSIKTSTR